MANLAIPTLTAPSVSNYDTAAWWNANVYQLLTYGLNPPIFVGTQTIAQSVATSTWSAITLDTEQQDTYGGHSTTTNSSRYTAQVAGWYTVCGVVTWTQNSTGRRGARLHVNGSSVAGSAQLFAPASGTTFTGVMTAVRAVQLGVGDYVEVAGTQSSGSALSTGVAAGGDLASALYVAWAHT
ncbi:hypothetical protein AB0N17_02900 [Streptomyces sp. NPDC051133]|uniref:hypothetical protein n=1 Tax=Streptomyces sp. NPDC051133 TaxID=3155521 RepID=UPI003447ED84